MCTSLPDKDEDCGSYMSLEQYSLRDHFPTELIGALVVAILPSLGGILTHHGLFFGDSTLDKALGWIIAHCSALFVLLAFFYSTLTQMSKIKGSAASQTWTRRDIFITFLPSMIRNALLPVFVYPGFILTCLTFASPSGMSAHFALYCFCFVFGFRVFPSFEWVQCLNGTPGKYAVSLFLDWFIPELTISNQYTWLLALTSTLIGCAARSRIFGINFFSTLVSLESLHAFIICRFFGTGIHAKASVNQYMNPSPDWKPVNGKLVFPVNFK